MSIADHFGGHVTASPNSFHYTLFSVCIFSKRWQESISFYQDIIGLVLTECDQSAQRASFDLGGARLVIESVCTADRESYLGYSTGISIETHTFKQTYNDLISRDVEFISLPEVAQDGKVTVEFYDPDGNIIALVGQAMPG